MFFKEKSLKKFNNAIYFVFLIIGTTTVTAAYSITDVTMKVFMLGALFTILLTMVSIIVSRAFQEKNLDPIKDINEKLDNLLQKFENDDTPASIPPNTVSPTQLPHIMEEWKTVIQTQMHFNDLLMKVRTATLSVVLAVFGAAGYSILTKDTFLLTIKGYTFHPSALIVFSGLVILISMFIIDYKYYYKMLIGAVRRGIEFDNEFRNSFGRRYFGMTTMIRDEIGKKGLSKLFVISFYSIPIFAGILFLAAVLIGFPVPST